MKKIIVFATLFLTACGAFNSLTGNVYAPKTAEWVSKNAKINTDKFTSITRVNFPSLIPRHFLNYKEVTGLSAWDAPDSPFWVSIIREPNKQDLYVVYFDIKQGEWSFYDKALDEQGKQIPFFKLDKQINMGNEHFSTSIEEYFALKISKEFLEQNKGKNPQIKIYGKRNAFVFFLPDYYIDGILQYINNPTN